MELHPGYGLSADNAVHEGEHAGLCNRQQIEIIPEGVESEQEKDYLRQNGARLGQGFLFSPPAPLPA